MSNAPEVPGFRPEGPFSPVPAAQAMDAPSPAEGEADEAPPAAKKNEESWGEIFKTLAWALLIAAVIRTFLLQPFNIPSGSMEGTLLIGDYLFVEKFAYGYNHYSFPFGKYLPSFGEVLGREPDRGDVIVFKMPNPDSPYYQEDYIKRVIGLPGDTVQMINDRLYLNGKIVPRVRVADYVENIDGYEHHVPQYRETLPNGKSYLTLDRDPDGPEDNTPLYIVPPGHYFMMGDNRDDSADSRMDVGYVPQENLVGKAVFRFFSTDGSAHFWEFWRWPWAIRYNRILTVID